MFKGVRPIETEIDVTRKKIKLSNRIDETSW